MTTPQSILWNLEYKVNEMMRHFQGQGEDGEENSFIDNIEEMAQEMKEMRAEMAKISDTMALILKVLNK